MLSLFCLRLTFLIYTSLSTHWGDGWNRWQCLLFCLSASLLMDVIVTLTLPGDDITDWIWQAALWFHYGNCKAGNPSTGACNTCKFVWETRRWFTSLLDLAHSQYKCSSAAKNKFSTNSWTVGRDLWTDLMMMSVLLGSYKMIFTWETFDLLFLFQIIISLQMLVYYLDIGDKYWQ